MSEILTVQFIQGHPDAKLPFMAHEGDACSDIYSIEKIDIFPGQTATVHTGLKVASIPVGYKIEAYDRSGFGKQGILLANAPGQIDSKYRGELMILLFNSSSKILEITPGDRIAQIALEEVIPVKYEFVESADETSRGEGGFGSTGVK